MTDRCIYYRTLALPAGVIEVEKLFTKDKEAVFYDDQTLFFKLRSPMTPMTNPLIQIEEAHTPTAQPERVGLLINSKLRYVSLIPQILCVLHKAQRVKQNCILTYRFLYFLLGH